jgi:hypothetical protein
MTTDMAATATVTDAAATRMATTTCAFRKLYPDVMVVQPGQNRDGDNGTSPLDCPT